MWQPLFANLAVTAMVLIAWSAIGEQISRYSVATQQVMLGLAMAIAVMGSMTMAYHVSPGVLYDLRVPIIAVASLFGGLPAAAIVAGVAAAYRLYLGGAITAGIASIGIAVALGLSAYVWQRGKRIEYSAIVVLAAAVALASILVGLILPAQARAVLMPNLAAPTILAFCATMLLGSVVLMETRRRDAIIANRLYRAMVEALPDCLNIKDLDGRFLVANLATAQLMGAKVASDLIGKTDFDFYPPELAKTFRVDELAVLASSEHATIEQAGRLPNGSSGWLSTLKAPVLDQNGKVAGLVTHNRDITAQKALQDKLAETQAYLDQALDNMSDGLVMFDRDGIVLFCNERYRELLPRTAHLRVAGSSFAEIVRGSIEEGEEVLQPGLTIAQHIRERQAQLKQDSERLVDLEDGRTFLMRTKVLPNGWCLRMMGDVTERRNYERKLEYQALHDVLTGLPNRALFNEELEKRLATARSSDGQLVVMLLDLDRFKQVNDNFGHAVGDKLLVEVGKRLGQAIRPDDMVARLGGDEFAILMSGPSLVVGAIQAAARVMKTLTQPLELDGVTLLPGATIGYTVAPPDLPDAEQLLKNADKALYQAKAKGRGTWKAYEEATHGPGCVLTDSSVA